MTATVGTVIIGRNEGERLVRCLESVRGQGAIVYVDSGSADGSAARARELGADVVELDMSIPFTAARARNAGFRRLREREPGVEFVQFIDGDCTLYPQWLIAGVGAMRERPDAAIVCGRLREQDPDGSVYNKLADMEWAAPVGDVQSCGGIFLARADRFDAVGGFLEDVIAGEEPELCSRLIERGWRIVRIPAEMARHDIAMTRFGQWWRRQVRAGYGGLYAFQRAHGRAVRPFAGQIRSARTWVLGWPAAVCVLAALGALTWGVVGAVIGGALGVMILPAQIARIALRRARRQLSLDGIFVYGTFVMLAKLPQVVGHVRLLLEQRRGVKPVIIEHKNPAPTIERPVSRRV